MLQMVQKKIVGKTPRRQSPPGNKRDADQTPQATVPTLNLDITILLKYLKNVLRFLDLPLIT